MTRTAQQDRARVRDLRAWFANLDEPLAFEALAQGIHVLLGGASAIAYTLAPRGDRRLSIDESGTSGMAASLTGRFDRWIGQRVVGWTGYNPIRPQPDQRNVAITTREILALAQTKDLPVLQEFLPRVGLAGHDQLRVLLCEGPSMLAWVGVFGTDPYGEREKALLRAVTPALRRRLTLERRLGGERLMRSAFLGALEALGSPAFLVRDGGGILETNAAGKALLARDRLTVDAAVADAVRTGGSPRFELTRVGTREALLVERGRGAELRTRDAAARWMLSPQQSRVLALVAEGRSNKAIAAVLEISERTVEAHLTAIYERTQVEGRSHLLAKLGGA